MRKRDSKRKDKEAARPVQNGSQGVAQNANSPVSNPPAAMMSVAAPTSGVSPTAPQSLLASAVAPSTQTQADYVSDHYAHHLRESTGASFMFASLVGLFGQSDRTPFKKYRDRLLADSGDPSDPIEVMMIEQIALAHMNIGRLMLRSSIAEHIDVAKAYGSMATQLLGEFRRTALALQAYRLSARQNAQASDNSSSPGSAISPTTSPSARDNPDTELVCKEAVADGDGTPRRKEEEPEARGCRPDERNETERSVA